jgi:uncharacterized protein (DUF362 family)/NAD-dependent dihydropyrimidine dehydrogenase PreA subunit
LSLQSFLPDSGSHTPAAALTGKKKYDILKYHLLQGHRMTQVSIAPCSDYSEAEVSRAFDEVLAPFGGLDWVLPEMRVVIKANLVIFFSPARAATTHPALICELCRRLTGRGAEVIVGDSPGGLYTPAFVNRVYAATGMREVEKYGGRLNSDYGQTAAGYPEAKAAKSFIYTSYLDRADAIINFCKLKTHGMMGMSAAVKNMFGVVPGTLKPEYHCRFPNHAAFADMLVDLNEYFATKTRLCICDAVVAMEGNGPTAGSPRKLGAIIASPSPYCLDLVAAGLIGLTKEDVPTLEAAYRRGLAPASAEELIVLGDYKKYKPADFKHITAPRGIEKFGGKVLGKIVGRMFHSRPVPDRSECTGCGVCANTCPLGVIKIQNGLAHIDRKSCIRCFCCQEFCPAGAMKVQRALMAQLLIKSTPAKKS